jgi:Rrf2 family transcriptional regulator, nitric oxide-sensitive transcriptional repressor
MLVRLSYFTDFSLRTLVYLAGVPDGKPVSVGVIAEKYRVSTHHMHKVAQGLRKLGYIESLSGRNGGLRLAVPADSLRIGDVVEAMEGRGSLAECTKGPCMLHGACSLKGALDRAERNFYDELRRYTLADIVRGPTVVRLQHMMRAA